MSTKTRNGTGTRDPAFDAPFPTTQQLFLELIASQRTLNYNVSKLQLEKPELFANVSDAIVRQYHNNNCSQRVCAFKEESFIHLLPMYRHIIAEKFQHPLVILHYSVSTVN